jgi:hypothetical protein
VVVLVSHSLQMIEDIGLLCIWVGFEDHNLRTCTAIGMVSTEFNSESNAKSIGARTASDGEFVFSTTAKASKDEASHDCRGRIRAEFDRLVRTATPIEFFRSV